MTQRRKETRQSARLTTLRMSVAQAKDSPCGERFHAIRSAFGTVIYYYCFTKYDYAVKGFASLTLALLKQVFFIDSAFSRTVRSENFFSLTRALRVTRYVFKGKQ